MFQFLFSSPAPGHTPQKSDMPAHMPGTAKGEEWVIKKGREPGRDNAYGIRTARDSTAVSPENRDPIDPRMPFIPPA